MRVLLIGGSGFIGPHVAAELAKQGHELAIFHRGRVAIPHHRSIHGERSRLAASRDAIAAFAPDVVVDLITSSERHATDLIATMRGITRRLVVLSSMDVYRACGVLHGFEPGPLEPLPLTEKSPLRTKLQTYPPKQIAMLQQVFGWLDAEYDKIPAERALLADGELAVTILRLPMVYGPGDALRRLHPLVKRIDDGRNAIIVPVAPWRASKGYVEDVAFAIALAAQDTGRTKSVVYNVGERDALSELEWAEFVAQVAGWRGELVTLPEELMPPHLRVPGNALQDWVADTSRIRRELGFAERVSRDEALRRTIAWERSAPVGFVPHRFDYPAEDLAIARRNA
ncbi:MAG: NAD-dependent epimerase/dehydratase family protein [Deltaproteobacteria bacterium]|nr:NAD-dependent epimerase/dehydratase family protein [Deltaproteobacteria bacterium]MCW5808518.1 NAD-dependent epimerase/dehydratase family protein [Deltaproteobacteria bacterium]